MKLKPVLILFILTLSSLAFCQCILKDYELLTTINIPQDLKYGIPSEVILDSTTNYLAVAYDYNPTYVEVYSIETRHSIHRFKIKGFTYFDNSYYHEADSSFYIDKGRYRNKYVKASLSDFSIIKVKKDKLPRGYPYHNWTETKKERDQSNCISIETHGSYAIRFNNDWLEIYLKRSTKGLILRKI